MYLLQLYKIIISFLLLSFCVSERELKFVYTHFRHGARGPALGLDSEGKDYFGQKWDYPQDLTGVGMRMHYSLGLRNRERYLILNNLLKNTFDSKEILIMSSEFNRTIQSALSQLEGLYGNLKEGELTEKEKENAIIPNILSDKVKSKIQKLGNFSIENGKQVFPIHTYNIKEHKFLLHEEENLSECQPIKRIRAENNQTEKMFNLKKQFLDIHKNRIKDYFKDNTNITEHLNETFVLLSLCDSYISDITDGRFGNKPPFEDAFETDCQQLLRDLWMEYIFGDKEKRVLTMSMSPIMRDIVHYINESINTPDKSPKFMMVSGHDVSLLGIFAFMSMYTKRGAIDNFVVPFATSMFLEVYQENNLTTIEYYIDNFTKSISTFEFDDFKKFVFENAWSDERIKDFCKFDEWGEIPQMESFTIVIYVFGGIVVVIIVLLIGCIINTKRKFKNS